MLNSPLFNLSTYHRKADYSRPRAHLPLFIMLSEALVVTLEDLKQIIITAAVSAGMYGINVALSISCLYLLTTTKGHIRYPPAKMILGHFYILAVLGLATHAAVYVSQFLVEEVGSANITGQEGPYGPYHDEIPISLPFVILTADAFMVCTSPALLSTMSFTINLGLEVLYFIPRHR